MRKALSQLVPRTIGANVSLSNDLAVSPIVLSSSSEMGSRKSMRTQAKLGHEGVRVFVSAIKMG